MKHEEREVRQIYNDYGDDLYRLCYFYTGNVHDAMDAVQNTLVHLMEYTGTRRQERFCVRIEILVSSICL